MKITYDYSGRLEGGSNVIRMGHTQIKGIDQFVVKSSGIQNLKFHPLKQFMEILQKGGRTLWIETHYLLNVKHWALEVNKLLNV